jgi:hypothetical protein
MQQLFTVCIWLFYGIIFVFAAISARQESKQRNKHTEALKKIAAINFCGFCEEPYSEKNHSPLCPISVAREALK